MTEENLTLLPAEQLPQTDEPKRAEKVNILQDMLLELMNERNVTLGQIKKATGIPWSTLMGWHNGTSNCQLADKNLLKLAQFFRVQIEYLCFGIGSDEPLYEEFKNESA